MPLVMQSVSCVTVDIGTVMYQLGKRLQQAFVSKQFGFE